MRKKWPMPIVIIDVVIIIKHKIVFWSLESLKREVK